MRGALNFFSTRIKYLGSKLRFLCQSTTKGTVVWPIISSGTPSVGNTQHLYKILWQNKQYKACIFLHNHWFCQAIQSVSTIHCTLNKGIHNILILHSIFGTWRRRPWIYTFRILRHILNHVWHGGGCRSFMTVCTRRTSYIWMEPLEEDVSACQVFWILILFGLWTCCVIMWFCRAFHVAEGKVKRLGFNASVEYFFKTLFLTNSQIFMFFALC